MAEKVIPRSADYSGWYNDVVQKAQLADYAPVRGCMVIMPYGYALWENVQAGLDRRFKATGHKNAYFPLFIPMSFLKREAEHVEGFSPQLAIVTIGGGERLDEPLVIRPTSETIIGHMYAQWIRSYRDLPILINVWSNVVRWEQRTRLFLRTLEFLWQEGHTAHVTEQEAEEETMRMLGVYADFAENDAAIPVIKGRKSESEKFAGAKHSYSIEAMMGDRRALQAGTSHNLGQNFARAFNIQYLDRDNTLKHCWTTSWGMSTRIIGAIVMVHGDDQGLQLPPRLAPIQAVIVPIWKSDEERTTVLEAVDRLRSILTPIARLEVDDREGITPGFKFNEWEMKGVPLRVEVGPRDVASQQVVLARRDIAGKPGKTTASWAELPHRVPEWLNDIQANMLAKARRFLAENTYHVESDYDELRRIIEGPGGFVWAWWCGNGACEARVKEETKATTRNIPFDQPGGTGKCVVCGAVAKQQVVFAKAY